MMEELKELVAKLENAFHDRLVSVILYGAAAAPHATDFSDLNIFCVLKQVTPRELADGEPVIRWWRGRGHISPLMMSEEEAQNSADSFSLEFTDMQERRKVLYGIDAIADLHVDPKYYRVQLEHDLRSKLLRLRQQAAAVLSDDAALMKLCLDSVTTFCFLGRHVLRAAHVDFAYNNAERQRRAVVEHLAKTMRADMTPFTQLLDLRDAAVQQNKPPVSVNPAELFAAYLECVRKLVEFVDRLEEKPLEAKS
jgi:aryl carrier-like protein